MNLRNTALLAVFVTFGLNGCTLFGDKHEDSPAKMREALEVPPDLARPASDDLSAVPPGGAAAYSDYAAKKPSTSSGNTLPSDGIRQASGPASASVRLERDGAQRWLVVQGNSERVWVRARDYFLRNKLSLTVDDPRSGVLETDWVERPVEFTGVFSKVLTFVHSSGLRDKYRIRVERGREPGTAEVYVSHHHMAEVVVDGRGPADITQTKWMPRAADPLMEADMLGKLLVHFGLDTKQAMSAIAAVDGTGAQMIKGALIVPQDDLDSVWRRVGQALDRAGVIIEDRDRSAGIFYVRYLYSGQPNKRKGLFSWFTSDSSTATGSEDYRKQLPNDRFQVRLKTTTDGTSVAIFNVNGEPDESPAGEQLLGVLQKQLF